MEKFFYLTKKKSIKKNYYLEDLKITMQKTKPIKASELAQRIEGKLYGPDMILDGHYTFLNKAEAGDIVIRHWINDKGIEIAKDKGISCVITQNPHEDAVATAENLDFCLIVTDYIEYATAYALNLTVKKYATDTIKIATTGTNGKSTTTHLLYTIFSDLGFKTYTNTDAESEGNTLIDPKVASELPEFYQENNGIDVITLEVSEIQGWDDRIMENHAYEMIHALDADVAIITNASMDHINLLRSFDHLLDEISGAAKAVNYTDKHSLLVLNYEDKNIAKMSEIVKDNSNVDVMYFGNYDDDRLLSVSYKPNVGIYVADELYIKYDDLPFTSMHFIQDIMAAVAVCVYYDLDHEKVVESLRNYKPLARRFIKLRDNPVIIDDFAHNPSGIKLTIENGYDLGSNVYIVDAIRGSRGDDINREIAEALAQTLKDKNNYTLYITSSVDVVDHLNWVEQSEFNIFEETLNRDEIEYSFVEKLEDCLLKVVGEAGENDVILLLGAQGMDPASGILAKHNII